MKKKIIYISGHEVFDMNDIRAAFADVRAALNLGDDTVLFGVPVDADDALETPTSPAIQSEQTEQPILETEPNIEPVVEPIIEPIIETVTETIVNDEPIPEQPIEKQKKSRGRPRAAQPTPEPVTEPEPISEIAAEPESETQSEPVVPILSVLAGGATNSDPEPDEDPITEPEPISEPEIDILDEIVDEPIASITPDIEPEPIVETTTITEIEIQTVNIDDVIADDTPPVEDTERTLEDILERMSPLDEDMDEPDTQIIDDDEVGDSISHTSDEDDATTDATLEKLAAEFARTQDDISTAPPPQTTGKIGKLKNLIPFKKPRRDDTGLMGDLFGWAGIAANDDEFAMPDFFPKK